MTVTAEAQIVYRASDGQPFATAEGAEWHEAGLRLLDSLDPMAAALLNFTRAVRRHSALVWECTRGKGLTMSSGLAPSVLATFLAALAMSDPAAFRRAAEAVEAWHLANPSETIAA